MQSKKLDYIWNSLGSFLQSAISPILLIFITRLNGIDDSGLFSFALSLSVVFWAISLWGGRTYQVSDVKREFSAGGYVMVRLVASIVAAGVAVALCVASGYSATKTLIIMLLVGFKVIESVADALYGILQAHDRLYVAGKSLAIKAIVGLGMFVVIDLATHNIIYGSAALLLVNLAVIFLYDIRWTKRFESIDIRPVILRRYVHEAMKIMHRTAPVCMVMFMTMFSLNIPRYFLDQHHPAQIGFFGIMAMPITLLALFMSFIIQPNIVGMAKLHTAGKTRQFHSVVVKLVYITLGVGLVALLMTYFIGIWVLETVFGTSMQQFQQELLIMVAGAVVNALVSVYVNVLIVIRVFRWQWYTLFITNIIAAVCSALYIQQYAMMGAVMIFALTNLVQAACLMIGYRLNLKKV